MKRNTIHYITVLLVITVIACMAGCSSVSLDVQNPDGSPSWTTNPPNSKSTFYGIGTAKLSDQSLSLLKAETLARDDIARQASSLVQSSLINYMEEAGELNGDSQALELFEALTVQISKITLRGVQKEQIWISPDGTTWVISSYPTKNLKEAYKLQVQAFEQRLRLLEAEKGLPNSFSFEQALTYLDEELELMGN